MKLILALLVLLPSIAMASFVPSSFSAKYEESLTSATGKVKKSHGTLDYKFPGHLRFEVLEPVKSLFVVNPEKAWFYQPAFVKGEKDQVTVQKSANLPLVKFLDSVKNGLENSKLFNTRYEKNDLILTFVKSSQKDLGIEEVILHANKPAKEIKTIAGFETMTLKHANKNKTNIRLKELKENVSFSSAHFVFKPSPDTKVISN